MPRANTVPIRFSAGESNAVARMLSRQYVRENPEVVRDAVERKGVAGVDVDEIVEIDEEWRELKARGDELRHERNEVSRSIGELKQEGKEEEAQEAIERSGALKDELEDVEARADELDRTRGAPARGTERPPRERAHGRGRVR